MTEAAAQIARVAAYRQTLGEANELMKTELERGAQMAKTALDTLRRSDPDLFDRTDAVGANMKASELSIASALCYARGDAEDGQRLAARAQAVFRLASQQTDGRA